MFHKTETSKNSVLNYHYCMMYNSSIKTPKEIVTNLRSIGFPEQLTFCLLGNNPIVSLVDRSHNSFTADSDG